MLLRWAENAASPLIGVYLVRARRSPTPFMDNAPCRGVPAIEDNSVPTSANAPGVRWAGEAGTVGLAVRGLSSRAATAVKYIRR
jgi:hypothetical protein